MVGVIPFLTIIKGNVYVFMLSYDFIKLPRWVMEIPYLDLTECVVLSVLLNAESVYVDKSGEFFLKYDEIAQMSKLSLSQTKRVIKKLEGYNLITTVRRKRMHYRLEWDKLNLYNQEEQFKAAPKPAEQTQPEPAIAEVKPIEEITMKEITMDDYKQDEVEELPTPDDDRYEFSSWVTTQAQAHFPRWIALVKNRRHIIAFDEMINFANNLSAEYYDGAYQSQIREILGRRIRNAA